MQEARLICQELRLANTTATSASSVGMHMVCHRTCQKVSRSLPLSVRFGEASEQQQGFCSWRVGAEAELQKVSDLSYKWNVCGICKAHATLMIKHISPEFARTRFSRHCAST